MNTRGEFVVERWQINYSKQKRWLLERIQIESLSSRTNRSVVRNRGKGEAGRKFLQADIEVKDFPAVCRAKIKLERVHLPPSLSVHREKWDPCRRWNRNHCRRSGIPAQSTFPTKCHHDRPLSSFFFALTHVLHNTAAPLSFAFPFFFSSANRENEGEKERAGKVDRIDERCPNANKITSGRQWAGRPPLMMTKVMKRSRLSLFLCDNVRAARRSHTISLIFRRFFLSLSLSIESRRVFFRILFQDKISRWSMIYLSNYVLILHEER